MSGKVTRTTQRWTIFETAIGHCAVGWEQSGVTEVRLPERDLDEMRCQLFSRGATLDSTRNPRWVERVTQRLTLHLRGEFQDFRDVPLAIDELSQFRQRVYLATREVLSGTTATYGQIAGALGSPGAARAVGGALGSNPFSIVVPCHRILGARGSLGGFSAFGGTRTKVALLEIEGVVLPRRAPRG